VKPTDSSYERNQRPGSFAPTGPGFDPSDQLLCTTLLAVAKQRGRTLAEYPW
jgi:hypothetical protein